MFLTCTSWFISTPNRIWLTSSCFRASSQCVVRITTISNNTVVYIQWSLYVAISYRSRVSTCYFLRYKFNKNNFNAFVSINKDKNIKWIFPKTTSQNTYGHCSKIQSIRFDNDNYCQNTFHGSILYCNIYTHVRHL